MLDLLGKYRNNIVCHTATIQEFVPNCVMTYKLKDYEFVPSSCALDDMTSDLFDWSLKYDIVGISYWKFNLRITICECHSETSNIDDEIIQTIYATAKRRQ